MAVIFIGGGNRSTRRKLVASHFMFYRMAPPERDFEFSYSVVIGTDCIGIIVVNPTTIYNHDHDFPSLSVKFVISLKKWSTLMMHFLIMKDKKLIFGVLVSKNNTSRNAIIGNMIRCWYSIHYSNYKGHHTVDWLTVLNHLVCLWGGRLKAYLSRHHYILIVYIPCKVSSIEKTIFITNCLFYRWMTLKWHLIKFVRWYSCLKRPKDFEVEKNIVLHNCFGTI